MAHPDIDRFERLYRLADKLIADADKANLAKAARILSLDLAQYHVKYSELPADEYVSLAAEDHLTPELAKTLADGMENLAGVLGRVLRAMGRMVMRSISETLLLFLWAVAAAGATFSGRGCSAR